MKIPKYFFINAQYSHYFDCLPDETDSSNSILKQQLSSTSRGVIAATAYAEERERQDFRVAPNKGQWCYANPNEVVNGVARHFMILPQWNSYVSRGQGTVEEPYPDLIQKLIRVSSKRSEKSKQRSLTPLPTPPLLPPPSHQQLAVPPFIQVDDIDKRIDQRETLRQRLRDEVLAEMKASGQFGRFGY